MIAAVLIAVASIAAGIALGLGGRRGALVPLATFAVVAALAVVLVQLLPDAIAGLGPAALAIFAAGLLLPRLLELAVARIAQRARSAVGLELSYAALLVHQLGDGVGMGTYSAGAHAHHGHFDILFAIAAHTVPMVALLTIAYHRQSGTRAALVRGAGLMLAEVAGVAIAALAPQATFAAFEAPVTAAIAGLLVHVVMHDWKLDRGARSWGTRSLEVLAIGAGVLLVTIGGHDEEAGAAVRTALFDALRDIALRTGPALLVGLVAASIVSAWSGRIGPGWLTGSPAIQAAKGAVVGAPHPICACGALPVAHSMHARGAKPAWVVAFLVAAPGLGLTTFALSAELLGWRFALLRSFATVFVAIASGLAAARFASRPSTAHHHHHESDAPTPPQSFLLRALSAGDELLLSIAPWAAIGVLAAALLQVALPDLPAAGPIADLVLVTLLAVPSYVCAASATPLAAVLLGKGLSPPAVMAGLLLGPAMNLATFGFLRRTLGRGATIATSIALIASAWALSLLAWPIAPVVPAATPGPVAVIMTATMGALIAVATWQHGLRGFFASLAEGLGNVEPEPDSCVPGHHVHLHEGHHHTAADQAP